MTVVHREQQRFDIWHEVPLVPQLTGMSCWAAAAAMIVGWRDCVDVRPEEVAAGLGRWDAYRRGLEPADVDDLARVFDLVIEPARTYSVDELRRLLERVGPLWVGEAVPGLHVVVVAGMAGDGTPDGTWVRIADPWPIGRGERYRISFRELATNLAVASGVVGATAQVLHSDGNRAGRSSYRSESRSWLNASVEPWPQRDGTEDIMIARNPPHAPSFGPARPLLSGPRGPFHVPPPGTIVLDPGHGGSAPAGSSSPYGVSGPGGTVEKAVTLSLAKRVAAYLGPNTILTRERDVNLPLVERSDLARRHGSRVFVSIHANGGDARMSGAEAYVHRRAGAASRALAVAIQNEMAGYGAAAPVGAEEMAVLTPERLGPSTAACLLEVDYLSDPGGEQRLRDPRSLDHVARAIARGIRRYGEASGALETGAEGQSAPVIIGIVGIGVAVFSLVSTLTHWSAGSLTWSRNITRAIHTYPPDIKPNAYHDVTRRVLEVNAISGVSSAWASFVVRWRANGNDIDQCRVEMSGSSDWTYSKLTVAFEGSEATSFEQDSVGCIMMYATGTCDPAGTGDSDFSLRMLIKADGTAAEQEFQITRGDPNDWNWDIDPNLGGYRLEKR
jgi:N-acetylmuramoyl-L-alanine amidase